jgi:hypothetical protein
MPNSLFFALVATFGYFVVGNLHGAYSTYALLADPEHSAHANLGPYYSSIAFSLMRAVVCFVALSTVLLAKKARTAQFVSIAGISALILTMLPNAPVVYQVISVLGISGAAGVMPLVLSLVWLVLLLVAVISNYAFKRTAGTLHRVS